MRALVEGGSVPAAAVRCEYTNGDPVDAEVLVYSPSEPARIFQRLRTDLRGRASFVPDSAGLWRVVVDDGLGHREEVELSIDEEGIATAPGDAGAGPLPARATAILALALGAWWLLRRRERGR